MRATLGDLDGDGDLDTYVAVLPPKGGDYDLPTGIRRTMAVEASWDLGQRLETTG